MENVIKLKIMVSYIINKNKQYTYIYVPIFIAFIWGMFSHFLNLDENNLDIVVLNITSFAIPPIFVLIYLNLKQNKIHILFLGLIYNIISFLILNSPLFIIKPFILVSIGVSVFNGFISLMFIAIAIKNKTTGKGSILKFYNYNLIAIIPISFLGYILIFVGLLKTVYWFF